jgi:glycosyltransferase involved in cell wall biosynthesis
VVTVTEAIRRQYVAGGLVPADRVVTLHGGADGARFHEEVSGRDFRRSLGVPDDLPMVGLVSGLRAMKGHGTLIEAARRLAGAGWRFQLLLVGRGPLEREISAAVDRAGIRSRVTIAGFVPELPPAMAACDVAVYCPVESEGMSRVVFEYLAMGKALVASRVGAVPEVLVDGETALLVPAEEPALLAVAIGRLLGDRELGARLGAAAARLAHERFVAARLAERLVPLYARAATRAGQAR